MSVTIPQQKAPLGARDEDVLEVLARPPAGPPVDVACVPPFEAKSRPLEDLRVQIAAVIDHDAEGSARLDRDSGARK